MTRGTVHAEASHTLSPSPYWYLGVGQTDTLVGGITVPFATQDTYQLINLWAFGHPEDTVPDNNTHEGVSGVFVGEDFLPGGKMSHKMCPQLR